MITHFTSLVLILYLLSIPVQNVTTRLAPNPTEPPVNSTVREAIAVMHSLPSTRHQLELHMDNTSRILNKIRNMVASIPYALHLVNGSSVTLAPSRRTIENPLTNEISFDIKTYSNEGVLLYMVGDQQNLTQSRQSGEQLVSVIVLFCFTLSKCWSITRTASSTGYL